MENYRKGKNLEEPLDRKKIEIPGLPQNFLWMQLMFPTHGKVFFTRKCGENASLKVPDVTGVRGGSKIRNVLTHALNEFPKNKSVVWTGFGPSVGKTITCAEIMKREHGSNLHQITKISYRTVEEYWDPLLPELDQLVVKRKLPMIHICLSSEPLDTKQLGYQAPGTVIPYKGQNRQDYKRHYRIPEKKRNSKVSLSKSNVNKGANKL